jgi:transposase InsO family protein
MSLDPLVSDIFVRHRRRYGTRRIQQELKDMGHCVARRTIAKALKTRGLKAIGPKSFKPRTTESRHRLGYNPNLLFDAKEPTGMNQVWVGDITYLPLVKGGVAYLATLLDRYSRRIVGHAVSGDMTVSLVLNVLKRALKERQPRPGLIHHTDRGGQYAAAEYRAVLVRAGIKQSMSRAGDCYDNAFMESCFGTIKSELEMTEYENVPTAQNAIAEFIRYYNQQRKHSAIGYQTPNQVETKK